MKSEHWRIGIMGVIIAVLAVYWLSTFLKKVPAPSKTLASAAPKFTTTLTYPSLAPQEKEPEAPGEEKTGFEQGWARNPFALPASVHSLSEDEIKKGAEVAKTLEDNSLGLRLNSIFISNSRKLAIINSRVVTIGDEVGGVRILDIQRDRVIIGRGKQKQTILLDQGSISLTVKGE